MSDKSQCLMRPASDFDLSSILLGDESGRGWKHQSSKNLHLYSHSHQQIKQDSSLRTDPQSSIFERKTLLTLADFGSGPGDVLPSLNYTEQGFTIY